LLSARVGFGSLGGQETLAVGSPACRVVEQAGHGPGRRGGEGRAGRTRVTLEAAQQFHPHPRALTLHDPREEPVLLGTRQASHPRSQFAGIVGDLRQWWRGLGRDREQVIVEAEETGQSSTMKSPATQALAWSPAE
jgi:hypothetical protein